MCKQYMRQSGCVQEKNTVGTNVVLVCTEVTGCRSVEDLSVRVV